MSEDIERIASGLTKAQRRGLLNHPWWATTTYGTIKALRVRGLLDGSDLTPIGLRVRAYIEANK